MHRLLRLLLSLRMHLLLRQRMLLRLSPLLHLRLRRRMHPRMNLLPHLLLHRRPSLQLRPPMPQLTSPQLRRPVSRQCHPTDAALAKVAQQTRNARVRTARRIMQVASSLDRCAMHRLIRPLLRPLLRRSMHRRMHRRMHPLLYQQPRRRCIRAMQAPTGAGLIRWMVVQMRLALRQQAKATCANALPATRRPSRMSTTQHRS